MKELLVQKENTINIEKVKNYLAQTVNRKINSKKGTDENSDLERNTSIKEFKNILSALGDDKNDLEEFLSNDLVKNSEKVATYLLNKYSIEDISGALHKYFMDKKPDRITINELVVVDIDTNDNSRLRLHLLPTFKNPKEMLELFNSAINEIKIRISDGVFPGIKHIGAYDSWIVYKNKDLLEKTGFSITNIDEVKKVGSAEIVV